MVTRKTPAVRIAFAAAFLVLALALVPAALAGKPGGGGGGGKGGGGTGGTSCTRNTPGVTVANTWQWGTTGSWGLAGQQLTYAISVINADVGCSSSSFLVTLSAPSGFSVSIPTSSIGLNSGASGYVGHRHLAAAFGRRQLPADRDGHAGRKLEPRRIRHDLLQGLLHRHRRAVPLLGRPGRRTGDQWQVVQFHGHGERRSRGPKDRALHRQHPPGYTSLQRHRVRLRYLYADIAQRPPGAAHRDLRCLRLARKRSLPDGLLHRQLKPPDSGTRR
jgi:hypothetical protein